MSEARLENHIICIASFIEEKQLTEFTIDKVHAGVLHNNVMFILSNRDTVPK